MGISDVFKPKYNKVDLNQKFFKGPVVFTDEEVAAINKNLQVFSDMAKASSEGEGEWVVTERVKDGIVAQGLSNYVDDLIKQARSGNYSDEQFIQIVKKAISAKTKAFRVFPLPFFLFEVACMLKSIGNKTATSVFRSFLESQERFKPDETDGIFLKAMQCNIDSAMEYALKEVG
jgi:hypothetical protein